MAPRHRLFFLCFAKDDRAVLSHARLFYRSLLGSRGGAGDGVGGPSEGPQEEGGDDGMYHGHKTGAGQTGKESGLPGTSPISPAGLGAGVVLPASVVLPPQRRSCRTKCPLFNKEDCTAACARR